MRTLKTQTLKTLWLMAGIGMALAGCSQQPAPSASKTQASQILSDIQYKPVKGKKAKKLSDAQANALAGIVGAPSDRKPLDDQGNPLWSEAYARRGFNVFGRYLKDLATAASERGSSVVSSREFKDLHQDYACLYGYSQAGLAEEDDYHTYSNSSNDESSPWLKGKRPDLSSLEGKVRYVGKSLINLRKVLDKQNPNLEFGAFQMSYQGSSTFKNCRREDGDVLSDQNYWSKKYDASNLYTEIKYQLKAALEEQEPLLPKKEAAEEALSRIVAKAMEMDTPDTETQKALEAAKAELMAINAEVDALQVKELTQKLADAKKAYIDLEINHLANLIHTTKRADGSISYQGGVKIDATADASKRVDYFDLQEEDNEMYGVKEPLAVALERVSGKIQGEWMTEGQAFSIGYNKEAKALEEYEFKFNKLAFAIHMSVEQFADISSLQTDQVLSLQERRTQMKKILEDSTSCAGSIQIGKETWSCEEFTQAMIDESLPTDEDDEDSDSDALLSK